MKFFTLEEMVKSSTASRYGIKNTPNEDVTKSLVALVDNLLDPLRSKFKKPIIVNSGYRCSKLNSLVGGSKTSQHVKGQAADIQSVGDKYNKELFELAKEFDFDQMIYEFGSDECPDWIHISYVSPEKNRHQILRSKKVNGKTVYTRIA